MLIVRAMRTVEDTATEAATVRAATTHQRTATGRHLIDDHDHDQRDRSTTIHLPTTPYHQVTIAADTNNNHDHHRNFEHQGVQRHDHWNKCKSIVKQNERPWDRPTFSLSSSTKEGTRSLMTDRLWLKGGGGGDGGGNGRIENGSTRRIFLNCFLQNPKLF